MMQINSEDRWYTRLLQPRVPFYRHPMRPADVSDGLCSVMLAREIALEDVDYSKVVPNRYVVEVNPESYAANFQLIEDRVLKQWTDRLFSCLLTANSRQGRQAYRLGGPVQIEIRPVSDLNPYQVRILARIQPEGERRPQRIEEPQPVHAVDASNFPQSEGCLEPYAGGARWPLKPGITTLGRDSSSDLIFNHPEVVQRRLVSGQHAFLRSEGGEVWLFDGSPAGRPSINGTYVNRRRVPVDGTRLRDGDVILLASADPNDPHPEMPGVVALRFRTHCT